MTDAARKTTARRHHWDAVYRSRRADEVSWYQPVPATSMRLVDQLALPASAGMIDVGGGASALADGLLQRGFTDLSVLDISRAVLDSARHRLGDRAGSIAWVCHDVLSWRPERRYDVWHDRAVFHFLVDAADRQIYMDVLGSALKPGGYAIMGTFAPDGPEQCSGLPVERYDVAKIAAAFGPGYTVVSSLQEDHVTPAGSVQPFTWAVLRAV